MMAQCLDIWQPTDDLITSSILWFRLSRTLQLIFTDCKSKFNTFSSNLPVLVESLDISSAVYPMADFELGDPKKVVS